MMIKPYQINDGLAGKSGGQDDEVIYRVRLLCRLPWKMNQPLYIDSPARAQICARANSNHSIGYISVVWRYG